MKKICSSCKIEKETTLFSGDNSQCKECVARKHREKRKGSPCISCGKPKEFNIAKGAKLCKSCGAVCYKCKTNPRKYQHRMCVQCIAKQDKERKSKPETKKRLKINKISCKYKIPKEYAQVLLEKENCQCCGKFLEESKDRHIDHCHTTGKVRDVLCFNCNAALGHINDNQERLIKLLYYLSKHTNGIQDLEKAKHFIDLLIEFEDVDE